MKIEEDPASVLKEFKAMLVMKGYSVGKNKDGNVYKYPRFLKKLFDSGVCTLDL